MGVLRGEAWYNPGEVGICLEGETSPTMIGEAGNLNAEN